MKLRQAKKILARLREMHLHNGYYGTTYPPSWRRYVCMWHKAYAVFNHHHPLGRLANKWANDNMARIIRESKVKQQQQQQQ